jgi:hypothetical protein
VCTGILVAGLIIWAFLNPISMKSSSHASSWMVSISQLVSLVQNLRPGANTGTVRNQFTSVGQHLKRHPSSAELNWLRQQNAVSNSTAHVVLITISAAVRVLDKLQVPGEVITQLKTMQTAQPVQPPPHTSPLTPLMQHHAAGGAAAVAAPTAARAGTSAAACAGAGPSAAAAAAGTSTHPQIEDTHSPCIQAVLPNSLPLLTLTSEEIHVSRYGITTHKDLSAAERAAIEAELGLLVDWWMEPIQLSRPKGVCPIGNATWLGYKSELSRFLGYCRLYQGVEHPTLHHLLNAHLLLHFISFLRGRGVQPVQLSDMALKASRVAVYLHSNNRLSPTCIARLPGYLEWLDNLVHQCKHNLQPVPGPSLAELQEQGRWIDPVKLLQSVVQAHTVATQLLPTNNSASMTRDVAVQIMQTSMCCFFYGFMLPNRPSVVITLQHPAYNGDCLVPRCQHKARCKGNRLEWAVPPQQAGSTSTVRKLKLVAPHHKTRPDAQEKIIEFFLPDDMQELMRVHLSVCLPLISQCFSYDTENGLPPTVFIWPSTGKQVSPQQVSKMFQKVVVPSGFKISPQVARAAFSTLVRDDAMQGGFGNVIDQDGAAALMGHSIEMWDEVYDRKYAARRAQEAVDNLARFRHSLLPATAGPGVAAAVGGGGGGAAAAAGGGGSVGVESDILLPESDCEYESESESGLLSSSESAGTISDDEFYDCNSE